MVINRLGIDITAQSDLRLLNLSRFLHLYRSSHFIINGVPLTSERREHESRRLRNLNRVAHPRHREGVSGSCLALVSAESVEDAQAVVRCRIVVDQARFVVGCDELADDLASGEAAARLRSARGLAVRLVGYEDFVGEPYLDVPILGDGMSRCESESIQILCTERHHKLRHNLR